MTALDTLPTKVRQRLDELQGALVASLGDSLDAMLVYGSAARGDYRPDESDVDVMLVLVDDPRDRLVALGPALQLARYAARIEVMILRRDEIPRATDCFPLLYDDIARHHVVLRGTNPFADLPVEREHRRLRIEQELREARIRMRRVASDMGAEPTFGRALERKLKQVRGPLAALLALRGTPVEDRFETVLESACELYGVDRASLRAAREHPAPAFDALARLLDAALADVDALATPTRKEATP